MTERADTIAQEYLNGATTRDLVKKYGISDVAIYAILKRRNIPTRPYNTKLTQNTIDQIISKYQEGLLLTDIAAQLNISKETVSKYVRKTSSPNRTQIIDYTLAPQVIELFSKQRVSVENIASELNVVQSTVYSILNKNHIKLDHRRKYLYDFDFFNKDTVEAAYFAGFCMADGNLYCGKREKDIPELRIQIHKDDISVLEKFCSAIKLDPSSIKHYDAETPAGDLSPQVRCGIRHVDLPQQLLRWGIVSNKTYNFVAPQVPDELLLPYLIGWIDGDGCIFHTVVGNCLKTHLTIVGNPDAINWLAGRLKFLGYGKTISVTAATGAYAKALNIYSTKEIINMFTTNKFPKELVLFRKWRTLLNHSINL